MIKGYLFDYGATLDTAGCHWGQMLWASCRRCGVPVTEQQFRDAYVYGERTLGSQNLIAPEDTFYTTLGVKLRLEFCFLMQAGALKTDEGEAALMRERVLNEFGLDVFFKDIVESAEVGIRKPDSRIFEMGVQRLGLRPDEVVVVGDSFRKDVVPAKEAGCHAVWLKGEPWKQEAVDETVPDRIIYSLKELLSPAPCE